MLSEGLHPSVPSYEHMKMNLIEEIEESEESEENKRNTLSTIESCDEDLYSIIYNQDQEIKKLKEVINEQNRENEAIK